jgi:hypothetical protein
MHADDEELSRIEDAILQRLHDREPVGDHPNERQARGWAGFYSDEDGKVHLNETVLEDSTEAVRAGCLAHERVHEGYRERYPSIEDEAEAWTAAYQAYREHGGDINQETGDPAERTIQEVGKLIENGGGELEEWIRSIKGYEHAADTEEEAERVADILDSSEISDLSEDELLEVAGLMHVDVTSDTSVEDLAEEVEDIKNRMKGPSAFIDGDEVGDESGGTRQIVPQEVLLTEEELSEEEPGSTKEDWDVGDEDEDSESDVDEEDEADLLDPDGERSPNGDDEDDEEPEEPVDEDEQDADEEDECTDLGEDEFAEDGEVEDVKSAWELAGEDDPVEEDEAYAGGEEKFVGSGADYGAGGGYDDGGSYDSGTYDGGGYHSGYDGDDAGGYDGGTYDGDGDSE